MTVTITGELPQGIYDVAVIGAGVVGTAIARELARYPVRVALLEACDDVGNGTSKANTAILHTGFDATPGTLESRLVREGYQLLSAYATEVGIPLERPGALVVAWDDDQLAALAALVNKAQRNEYHLGVIGVEELRVREPHLGPEARGALDVPGDASSARGRRRWPLRPKPCSAGSTCICAAERTNPSPGARFTRLSPAGASCGPVTWSTPRACMPMRSTGNSGTPSSP